MTAIQLVSQWQPITRNPDEPGWYATGKRDDKLSVPRYFDDYDNSWWIYSNHQDNQTIVPNNAFDLWTRLPLLPIEKE